MMTIIKIIFINFVSQSVLKQTDRDDCITCPPSQVMTTPDQPLIILSYKAAYLAVFAFTDDINITHSIPSFKNASATQIESVFATCRGLF